MVDGKRVDRQIGRVFDGYVPPAREALDDLDRRCWPLNKRGEREDPWLETSCLPLRSLEDGEMVVFSPLSKTARKALGDFVGVYRRADRNGKFPIVVLKSRQSGGLTYVPLFEIIGWGFWADDTPGNRAAAGAGANRAADAGTSTWTTKCRFDAFLKLREPGRNPRLSAFRSRSKIIHADDGSPLSHHGQQGYARGSRVMIDLRALQRALGGEICGGQLLCPGPGHSPRDRSLAVRLSPVRRRLRRL